MLFISCVTLTSSFLEILISTYAIILPSIPSLCIYDYFIRNYDFFNRYFQTLLI